MSNDLIRAQIKDLPTTPGIYQFKNDKGEVLYVGKSTNIRERIKSHLASDGEKTRAMVRASTHIEPITVSSELEALLLEAQLIKQYMPRYNSAAKDDKSPLYIKITTSEEYARVMTSRREDTPDTFFGPFPSSQTVKRVLKQIRRVFPYHSGQITKRPCLYSHIGLCNPCPGKIIAEIHKDKAAALKTDYQNNIKQIIKLLSNKTDVLKKQLEKEMKSVAKSEDFEKAASLRDQLNQLNYITSPYNNPREYLANPNFLEDVRDEELKNLYELLKPHYKYLKKPVRIECYDNSHLQGRAATSSMVTFINGEPDKNFYRHFRIRGANSRDDFAMMQETLTRRIKHFEDWGKPDLIVIDGGKGQVGAARVVFRELGVNIPVIGLAKRLEEIIVPKITLADQDKKTASYTVFRLPTGAPALRVLQRMRDEAHRFARRYHFKLRLREVVKSDKK
jgi:excinuclease ABC subunit C